MRGLIRYLDQIQPGKVVLWCYLIWYLTIVYFYFDPELKLWINSIGISAVIGTGLVLSVASKPGSQKDHWQTFRLYLMPFCVSSFSALIKERGFLIFLSPQMTENRVAIALCALFILLVSMVKIINRKL